MTASARRYTLLLVDDNPTNLLLLREIIELDLPEVRALTADSAAAGLEIAEQEAIDGAFVDVQMPRMNGLEMCRRLRQRSPTAAIPLVLMTAHQAAPELRAEGLEVGAYDFITQPISNVEMLARIKVMLRLCDNERRSRRDSQPPSRGEPSTQRMRWLTGLLMADDDSCEPEPSLLQQLATVLPDSSPLDAEQFFSQALPHFPHSWQRTLLKLGLLEQVPLALARQLSEINDISGVVAYLQRHELCLRRTLSGEDALSFAASVCQLLRSRAGEVLTGREQQQVYLTAADWFQQQRLIGAALTSLVVGEQYVAVSQLLSQFGLPLLDRPDRAVVVEQLLAIPEERAAQCGWQALFRGTVLLHQRQPDSADWLELAYQRFVATEQERGVLLALSQQLRLSFLLDGDWSRWQERLEPFRELAAQQCPLLEAEERLKVQYALGLAELVYAGRLARTGAILTAALAEARQLQLRPQQVELQQLRVRLALHQGRLLVARTAFEQCLQVADWEGNWPCEQVLLVAELVHAGGDLDSFLIQQQQLAAKGQATTTAAAEPLLHYYEALLVLAQGGQQRAEELVDIALTEVAARPHLLAQSRLLQLRGWLRARVGRAEAARADLEQALALSAQQGSRFSALENLLLAGATWAELEEYERAAAVLQQGAATVEAHQDQRYRPGFMAWSAFVAWQLGHKQSATVLQDAFLAAVSRHKLTCFWGLTPQLLAQLAEICPREEARLDLQSLLRQYTGLVFTADGPVPLLQIHSFGRFQLQLGPKVFDFSAVGHASRQIFALLTLTPDGSISLERLMALLWPESSTSKARSSLDTALARLRKALDDCFGKPVRSRCLPLTKGRLRLQASQIDSTRISALMEQARYHRQRGQAWQAELALQRVAQLWQGELFAGFDLIDALENRRAEFHQLRLEQLELLAQLLYQRDALEPAKIRLQQGLALDPTRDSLIRWLLVIYRRQQDKRSAILLLEKYRAALQQEEYSAEDIAELVEALDEDDLPRQNS